MKLYTLAAFSLNFSKEITEGAEKFLSILSIVLIVLIAVGILSAVVSLICGIIRIFGSVRSTKENRTDRKRK